MAVAYRSRSRQREGGSAGGVQQREFFGEGTEPGAGAEGGVVCNGRMSQGAPGASLRRSVRLVRAARHARGCGPRAPCAQSSGPRRSRRAAVRCEKQTGPRRRTRRGPVMNSVSSFAGLAARRLTRCDASSALSGSAVPTHQATLPPLVVVCGTAGPWPWSIRARSVVSTQPSPLMSAIAWCPRPARRRSFTLTRSRGAVPL